MAFVKNSIMFGSGGGSNITVVANYSALPDPTTVSGQFYWCESSQGTSWLPGSLGGTYYNSGMYYSNGVSWSFVNVPYQATQTEVNAGTNTDKFVTPNTFANAIKWDEKVTFWSSGIDGSTVANTLIITPTYSQLIPGGTFDAGDVMVLQARATAPGAKTSASSLIAYVNTTNNLSGATQIGIFTTAAIARTPQLKRTLSIKGSTTKVAVPATTSLTDDFNATAAMASITVDWTVDQYIIFAISHTVADQTLTGDMYTIQKL